MDAASGATAEESAQTSIVLYVLPTLSVILVCSTPALTLGLLVRPSHVKNELVNATKRSFSVLSGVNVMLSAIFMLSNYLESILYVYGIYGTVLATANLIADRVAKRRLWVALCIWHAVNLLTLVGGSLGPIVPYKLNAAGIIGETLAVSNKYGGSCPTGRLSMSWCSDAWVGIQVLTAFVYVVLHIAGFFLVCTRVAHHYGGGCDGDFDTGSFRHTSNAGLLPYIESPQSQPPSVPAAASSPF